MILRKTQLIDKTAADTVIDSAFDYTMAETLIIAPDRWKLKKAVCVANQILNALKVEKHPDQTFIGRALKEFYRLPP